MAIPDDDSLVAVGVNALLAPLRLAGFQVSITGRFCPSTEDDDEGFRTALAELLRDDGHTVQAYASTAELPPLAELSRPAALVTD